MAGAFIKRTAVVFLKVYTCALHHLIYHGVCRYMHHWSQDFFRFFCLLSKGLEPTEHEISYLSQISSFKVNLSIFTDTATKQCLVIHLLLKYSTTKSYQLSIIFQLSMKLPKKFEQLHNLCFVLSIYFVSSFHTRVNNIYPHKHSSCAEYIQKWKPNVLLKYIRGTIILPYMVY